MSVIMMGIIYSDGEKGRNEMKERGRNVIRE